jgi:hypothetical protein
MLIIYCKNNSVLIKLFSFYWNPSHPFLLVSLIITWYQTLFRSTLNYLSLLLFSSQKFGNVFALFFVGWFYHCIVVLCCYKTISVGVKGCCCVAFLGLQLCEGSRAIVGACCCCELNFLLTTWFIRYRCFVQILENYWFLMMPRFILSLSMLSIGNLVLLENCWI